MESVRIDILNPKVKKLLQDLQSLDLIVIRKETDKKKSFEKVLKKLRSRSGQAPTFEEITQEVEQVRQKRYEESQDNS